MSSIFSIVSLLAWCHCSALLLTPCAVGMVLCLVRRSEGRLLCSWTCFCFAWLRMRDGNVINCPMVGCQVLNSCNSFHVVWLQYYSPYSVMYTGPVLPRFKTCLSAITGTGKNRTDLLDLTVGVGPTIMLRSPPPHLVILRWRHGAIDVHSYWIYQEFGLQRMGLLFM